MAKPYFNDAVAGNSRMLCCFTGRGELVRLFWPNIDYPQHIEKLSAGIFFTDRKNSTLWLADNNWSHSQRYVPDTNIVETVYEDHEKGLIVIQHDFVLLDRDVLVRRYSVRNMGDHENNLGFVVYSSAISTNPDLRGTLFDFGCDAMVHYRHGYYLALTADREIFQYQLGDNAFESAGYTELRGKDSIGMMQDGALSWNLGRFAGGGTQTFTLFICASDTLKGVKQLVREIKGKDAFSLFEGVRNYWEGFLRNVRYMAFFNESGALRNTAIPRKEIEDLYKRSVLVFKLMADEKTGGLLAAPEVDEGFTRCGRYAYCWGRDAAFITDALDRCGLSPAVDKFYEWAVETQDDSGAWHQRYHMDGNLAPSWGLQIDETGTLIWGMLKHYKVTNDPGFLKKMWESVCKGTEFLAGFIDDETGLPRPSHDLWEERLGEHAYSAAAVYGGITAAIEIARILGISGEMIEKWREAADRIKNAIECRLWKKEWGRFIRSIRTKLNPWGDEYSQDRVVMRTDPKGNMRDFTLEDGTLDVSLLGLCIPFEVFDAGDERMERTVEIVEKALDAPVTGGIMRYENDGYIGGNPWVIATLWVALYHIRKENYQQALKYFEWAVKSKTGMGLLPEQVSKDSGKPAWVTPLTWSHAMFVLVLTELIDKGVL